jgi:hypothetical protein
MTWPPHFEIASWWDLYFIATDIWFAYMFLKNQRLFDFSRDRLYSLLVAMGTDVVCHISGDVLYILQWVSLVPFTGPFIIDMYGVLSQRYGWWFKAPYIPVAAYSGYAMLSLCPLYCPNPHQPWYFINHAIPHTMVVIMMILYEHALTHPVVKGTQASRSQPISSAHVADKNTSPRGRSRRRTASRKR